MQTPGELLKAEREKRGLSIKDVEQGTSIRSLYLTAIEQGNYSVVPGEVYLKGFIRNYASFLGLNPQEIMEVYRHSTGNAQPPTEQQPVTPTINQPLNTAQGNPPTTTQKVKEKRESSSSIKWAAIILIPVIGAASYWWYSQNTPQPKSQVTPKPAPTAPATPTQPAQPAPPAIPPASPASPQTKPVIVIAKFTDECWTQVLVDGKEVYEGIPKVGETINWEAQKNITIRLGNASGVDIIYNGQPQGKLGSKGEVTEKIFISKS